MLSIRQEQIAIISEPFLREFEQRVVAHLHRVWPEKCRVFGAEGVAESAREGIQRARQHGFRTERDVTRFVDVMYACGQNFDTDPTLAWAGAILRDERLRPPARMDKLYVELERRAAVTTAQANRT